MKPKKNIDKMNLDEITAYNKELLAELKRLLEERQAELQPATTPDPAPTVEDAPQYTISEKQRRRLAAFDDMSDDDQVDELKQMWE